MKNQNEIYIEVESVLENKTLKINKKKPYLENVPLQKILPEDKIVISLFSGAGGLDIGFVRAGFKIRIMIEKEPDPCKTLRANFHWEELKKRNIYKDKEDMKKHIEWYHEPEPIILEKDITNLTTKEILEAANLIVGEATVVTGGPPCQGFSTAGKRILDDPRNKLLNDFIRVVRETLPRTFILENVPGIISMGKGKIILEVCNTLAKCGYDISWEIWDASDYGVPQKRKRVIIMGKRIDIVIFKEKRNSQLHMAAAPGQIYHPEWFLEKYRIG